MELSIIIVSYNVKEYLRNCLYSVKRAAEGIEHKVFVVDNNSKDGSPEMVRTEFPGVTLIANSTNRGFSFANNQAVRISSGEYILLLNPDTITGEDTLVKCLKFMEEHPDAGILGVKMVNGEGVFLPESKRALPTPATAFFKVTRLNRLFPSSDLFNRYYLPGINNSETSTVEVIPGAFMFIRREAFSKTGLLDEDYFMYGEDIELSYRMLQTGYKNYYFPEVSITHFKGKSSERNSYSDILHFYRAMRIFSLKRHIEKFSPFYYLIIPGIWLSEFLALGGRAIRISRSKTFSLFGRMC